jgi:hypothetical protein
MGWCGLFEYLDHVKRVRHEKSKFRAHLHVHISQNAKVSIHVRLHTSTTVESPGAGTIQFYDIDDNKLELILRYQHVFLGFPSSIDYDHDHTMAPVLGVLKTHYDSIQSKYFIIYLQPNKSSINISSFITFKRYRSESVTICLLLLVSIKCLYSLYSANSSKLQIHKGVIWLTVFDPANQKQQCH